MKKIATWIRDSDDALFERFFVSTPGLVLTNAGQGKDTGDLLEMCDAVLLSGGPDIAAEFHVEPPADPTLIREPDPMRDAWEIRAVRAAVTRGLPLFCVCKGVQLLNVALGGTLHLDIRGHVRLRTAICPAAREA